VAKIKEVLELDQSLAAHQHGLSNGQDCHLSVVVDDRSTSL